MMTKDEAMRLALDALGNKFLFMASDDAIFKRAEAIDALNAALAQPEPEPVTWHHADCEGECIACLIEREVQSAYGNQGLTYLLRHITAPLQRKPLSEEKIIESTFLIDLDEDGWIYKFARAIEVAHGIKD